MQRWLVALALTVLSFAAFTSRVYAQAQPPSDKLLLDADSTWTWNGGNIIQAQGPVTIRLDREILTAQRAVIWLTPDDDHVMPQMKVEIALIGNAEVRQPARGITRTGGRLFVTVAVRGDIITTANSRVAEDRSDTPLFRQASLLRNGATAAPAPGAPLHPSKSDKEEEPNPYRIRATTGPTTRGTGDFHVHYAQAESVPTGDDTEPLALTGDVEIVNARPDGTLIEIHSQKAVVFLEPHSGGPKPGLAASQFQDQLKITSAYLEGDVRINYTPLPNEPEPDRAEDRLFANRVYYDFQTNQAILTDAVMRTSEPTSEVPITIRALKLRQLSMGEFEGDKVEMSTSSFATPTYSVKTDEVYLHQDMVYSNYFQAEEPSTTFVAQRDTVNILDVPLFYTPSAAGSIDSDPFPLRSFEIGSDNRTGFTTKTEWGLFESMGKLPPPGVDVSFLADYFADRGPATGLNGNYTGSNLDPDTNGFTDYNGQFKSFAISDHGEDKFGADRSDVTPPDQDRGDFLWQHQQFFPDHWQAQLRYGYISDPTLLEEYYPDNFFENEPYDAEAYLKRQQDTEALTFLVNADTNRFPTTSDQQQEQFDIERLPEIGYRRIGDSVADDTMTFYSENTADRIRFAKSHFSLDEQGFVGISPGLPSEGYTGTVSAPDYRGDTRQELDYPVQLGQIKMVPFTFGRLTAYSDSPSGDPKNRAFAGAGVRFTTAFWKIDNSAESELFDLHRVRHIIEPEINLFTSSETTDRSHLFIYDEDVDGIADVSAIDFTLHNRWQTYRGPPDKQESVDFLSWNIGTDIFTNPPTDAGLLPDKFRGLYFPSDPEASIPRDAINTDATWLVSDSTAILSDAEYNMDHAVLATAAVGLAVRRYDRMDYYLGVRYIEQLNSDLITGAVQYQLTTKYAVEISQSYDFGTNKDTSTSLLVRRQFDRLSADVGIYHDSTTGENGFRFNVYPDGLSPNKPSPNIESLFNNNQQAISRQGVGMAQELFTISQERSATVLELLIRPDMDALLFDALIESISIHLDSNAGGAWVLDLSKVDWLSSAGLGLLVNIRQKVRKSSGKLALCGLSPRLMELFRSCCLERLFVIESTRPKALAKVSH